MMAKKDTAKDPFTADCLKPRDYFAPAALQVSDGLEPRDCFALAALQGLLASGDARVQYTPVEAAKRAYSYADAMLHERQRGSYATG